MAQNQQAALAGITPAARTKEQRIMNPESTGTMTEIGYRVEARNTSSLPAMLPDNHMLGDKWRDVPFARANTVYGVPIDPWSYRDHHALMTYEGATALAWTFIAQQQHSGIECRLVQYRLQTTHVLEMVGVAKGAPISETDVRNVEIEEEDEE